MNKNYNQDEIKKDYVKSRIILNDIKFYINASRIEYSKEQKESQLLICIKNNLIPLKNLFDLKPRLNRYFIDNKDLQDLSKILNKNLEVSNKLRNRIAGHLDDDVTNNAVSWEPYIFVKIQNEEHKTFAQDYFIYKSLFESAVNSCIEQNGIFTEEIDILIPDKRTKLLDFMDSTNNLAIDFLEKTLEIMDSLVVYWNQNDLKTFLLSMKKASEVDFIIQKKRR